MQELPDHVRLTIENGKLYFNKTGGKKFVNIDSLEKEMEKALEIVWYNLSTQEVLDLDAKEFANLLKEAMP